MNCKQFRVEENTVRKARLLAWTLKRMTGICDTSVWSDILIAPLPRWPCVPSARGKENDSLLADGNQFHKFLGILAFL